jgi:hypothetical protein
MDLKVTVNCTSKLQTRPLVREGQKMSDSNQNLVMDPRGGLRHQVLAD